MKSCMPSVPRKDPHFTRILLAFRGARLTCSRALVPVLGTWPQSLPGPKPRGRSAAAQGRHPAGAGVCGRLIRVAAVLPASPTWGGGGLRCSLSQGPPLAPGALPPATAGVSHEGGGAESSWKRLSCKFWAWENHSWFLTVLLFF